MLKKNEDFRLSLNESRRLSETKKERKKEIYLFGSKKRYSTLTFLPFLPFFYFLKKRGGEGVGGLIDTIQRLGVYEIKWHVKAFQR